MTCTTLTNESWGPAYVEHSGRMHARARRVLTDPDLAQDAVQEAFLRAWRSESSFDPRRGSLAGWLVTITGNVAVDLARTRGRRVPTEPLRDLDTDATVGTTDPGIDGLLLRDQLVDALGQLGEDQRTVVREVVLRDRPAAEVAAELGVHPGTLRTRLHYALRRLRTILAAQSAG